MQIPTMAVSDDTRRILVVDDEAHILASLRSILESAGYHVTCVADLGSARNALDAETFHLVLTDLYLGSEDLGLQLAEAAQSCSPPVPMVLLTGRPSFDGAREALRSRVAEIVVKPVEPDLLIGTCERTIRETELARRARALQAQNRVLERMMPRMIEAKDPTTCGHAERVVDYTDSLAVRCDLDDDTREALRLASLFHDIGKIGVPDAILTKPGPLDAREREVIQRHPEIGYDILENLEGCQNVRRWVYQHHERWDGKGYPEGIGGEEVELPGRILVLAEVYDALAEPRSYKPAWPHHKIAAYFREQAGRQFDPELAHMVADGIEQQGQRFWNGGNGTLF